jgi:hypothetical protein
MCIWNCDYGNKITKKKKKQRKISQIFQNKICFYLFHYTNKNEKKARSVVIIKKQQKQQSSKFRIERK